MKKIDEICIFEKTKRIEVCILSGNLAYFYYFNKIGLFVDVSKLREVARVMFENDFYLSDFKVINTLTD